MMTVPCLGAACLTVVAPATRERAQFMVTRACERDFLMRL
jgi:hypothetical protein